MLRSSSLVVLFCALCGCGARARPAGLPASGATEESGVYLGPSRLALGRAHSCARSAGGTVHCWGANEHGQVGVPPSAAPVAVPVEWPAKDVLLLGAAGDRTCHAVDAASRIVRCTGASATVIEASTLYNPASLSVSDGAVCIHQTAEYEGSRLQCDAADAAIARLARPHPCAPESLCQKRYGFQVALRGADACLLEQNGPASKLECTRGAGWSYDGFEVTERANAFRAIALGYDFACVLGVDGARCWGPASVASSLDDARTVTGFPEPAAICATNTELCGIGAQGRVFCAPAGTIAAREIHLPGPSARATEIACGDGHACAVTTSGLVACWGDNHMGQLGDGTRRGITDAVIARIPPLTDR
ncbi:MAG: hypothetical protein HOO96_02440 [Polyangiaceae bacterium]|nr:hypothetical protein [Polyangiaceae bacterium]